MSTVEVWWARTTLARRAWLTDLDAVERGRFDAYLRDEDKFRFLVGATLVRRLLGERLQLPPARVPLDRTCSDCGKPHGKVRTPGSLEVSVTHSGELVGVALHDGAPVGLDVEEINPALDVPGLGRMALADSELRAVLGLRPDHRAAAFTTYWARKEAVVKATGDGMRADLRKLVVSPPDADAEVLAWAGHDELLQLTDVTVPSSYRAAVAVLTPEPTAVRPYDAAELLAR